MHHKYNKLILLFWKINCHPKLGFWTKSPRKSKSRRIQNEKNQEVSKSFSLTGVERGWTQYKYKIFNGFGATDAENDVDGGDGYDEVDKDDDDMDTGQVWRSGHTCLTL